MCEFTNRMQSPKRQAFWKLCQIGKVYRSIRQMGFAKQSHLKKNSPMHIGQVIRSLREQKGWSQEKLALEAGMVTSHVSRIERGERRLPTSRLDALAVALGTSPAAVYAMLEGLQPPVSATDQEGDFTVDFSPEALTLRKTFRSLPLVSRRLVVDFALMVAKRSAN